MQAQLFATRKKTKRGVDELEVATGIFFCKMSNSENLLFTLNQPCIFSVKVVLRYNLIS